MRHAGPTFPALPLVIAGALFLSEATWLQMSAAVVTWSGSHSACSRSRPQFLAGDAADEDAGSGFASRGRRLQPASLQPSPPAETGSELRICGVVLLVDSEAVEQRLVAAPALPDPDLDIEEDLRAEPRSSPCGRRCRSRGPCARPFRSGSPSGVGLRPDLRAHLDQPVVALGQLVDRDLDRVQAPRAFGEGPARG